LLPLSHYLLALLSPTCHDHRALHSFPTRRSSDLMLEKAEAMIQEGADHLKALGIVGTAVGTGLNAHPDYAEKVCASISDITGKKDRKSTRLNSSHVSISYAVFCLQKKKRHEGGR